MHAHTMRSHAKRATIAIAAALLCLIAVHPSAARAAVHGHRSTYAPHVHANIRVLAGSFLGAQRATWYGPGFFGHRTACGQTLGRATFGIAHRTLPCGTLVTLSHGSRRITVRVIDRGPYSGATLDLTQRTRDYLRFVDGDVNMAIVTRYRLAPRA